MLAVLWDAQIYSSEWSESEVFMVRWGVEKREMFCFISVAVCSAQSSHKKCSSAVDRCHHWPHYFTSWLSVEQVRLTKSKSLTVLASRGWGLGGCRINLIICWCDQGHDICTEIILIVLVVWKKEETWTDTFHINLNTFRKQNSSDMKHYNYNQN